jgi:hypothetical protein
VEKGFANAENLWATKKHTTEDERHSNETLNALCAVDTEIENARSLGPFLEEAAKSLQTRRFS